MPAKNTADYDFNFGEFKSVIAPTSQSIDAFMPHFDIGRDGQIVDEGLLRHHDFALELRLIFACYKADLATATPAQRKCIAKERDKQVALFWQRGLHQQPATD